MTRHPERANQLERPGAGPAVADAVGGKAIAAAADLEGRFS